MACSDNSLIFTFIGRHYHTFHLCLIASIAKILENYPKCVMEGNLSENFAKRYSFMLGALHSFVVDCNRQISAFM
jgi:hypothetical protein